MTGNKSCGISQKFDDWGNASVFLSGVIREGLKWAVFAISLAHPALRLNGLACGFSWLKQKLVKTEAMHLSCCCQYFYSLCVWILFMYIQRVSDSFLHLCSRNSDHLLHHRQNLHSVPLNETRFACLVVALAFFSCFRGSAFCTAPSASSPAVMLG